MHAPADLVTHLAALWHLDVGPAFPTTFGLPGNFVAPARRADGSTAVLKISQYVPETRTELAALRLWDGQGAARLLAADPDHGALLLEHIQPGGMLAEAATDEDGAVEVTAGLLRQLWRPLPGAHELRPLETWCAAYDRNRAALSRGVDGFPAALFQRADALRAHLLSSTTRCVALHGDLHHYNVLRSARAEWLAIDPKGLAGDPCFDICQFLRNPVPVPPDVNRRRVDVFCAELGLERERVQQWCLVHAMLNACWDYEDGRPWHTDVAYAEQTRSF